MIPTTNYNISSVQVSALGIDVCQIEGYLIGSTNRWLQVHDSCIAAASGAVPVYELPLNSTAQFFANFQIDNLHLAEGCFVAISTTEGTYTASTDKMDLTVWTGEPVISTNIVGDKTTAVNTLQVWSQATGAAGNKRLYGLIITELLGDTAYIYISSTDANKNPPGFVKTLQPNAALKLYFGTGLLPKSIAVPSTVQQGCTVWVSSASGLADGANPPVNASAANILAITN